MSSSVANAFVANGITTPAKATRPFVAISELSAVSSKSWLVGKMLGAAEMSVWYGPRGCGKGVIIEDMALDIAAGLD